MFLNVFPPARCTAVDRRCAQTHTRAGAGLRGLEGRRACMGEHIRTAHSAGARRAIDGEQIAPRVRACERAHKRTCCARRRVRSKTKLRGRAWECANGQA